MKKIITLGLLMLSFFLGNAQTAIWWDDAKFVSEDMDFGYKRPRIEMTANGIPVIVWNSSMNAYVSRWNGDGFNLPQRINHTACAGDFWMGPEIAAKGDTVYVTYKETPENLTDKHIFVKASFDGGVTFGDPVQVDTNTTEFLTRFTTLDIDPQGNPVVAYMRFNADYTEHAWITTVSNDLGQSFEDGVIANTGLGVDEEACDCCPGTIIKNKDYQIMMYRNNAANIRDSYAAISTNGGASYATTTNIDGNNWNISSCPSSGPDGFIIGDTLYGAYLSKNRVYYSKTSLSNASGTGSMRIMDDVTDLLTQNYPRIATNGAHYASAWVQTIRPRPQITFTFSDNIHQPLSTNWETLEQTSSQSVDIAMNDNEIFVVWQDNMDDLVKYKRGKISSVGINESQENEIVIGPNPTSGTVRFSLDDNYENVQMTVYDLAGKTYKLRSLGSVQTNQMVEMNLEELPQGSYIIQLKLNDKLLHQKMIKN